VSPEHGREVVGKREGENARFSFDETFCKNEVNLFQINGRPNFAFIGVRVRLAFVLKAKPQNLLKFGFFFAKVEIAKKRIEFFEVKLQQILRPQSRVVFDDF
jgi:hypothetical protein